MSTPNCLSGQEIFPTTRIQRAYFVGREPDLPLGGKECVAYLTFTGKAVDEQKLHLAMVAVAAHPALRMRFMDADHLTLAEGQVPELKIHHQHRSQEDEHGASIRERMLSQSVDLTSGRLWAVELTQWHDGTTTLHIAISLAVVDLPGLTALMHYLALYYRGESPLPQCVTAERLYQQLRENQARRDRKRQRGRDKLAKLAQGRMVELPPPPELPFTTFRPASANETQPDVVVRRSRCYSPQQWSRLKPYAAKLGVATSALVLALYARALRLCSANPDFIVTVTNVSTTGSAMQLAERTIAYAHRARTAESLEALVRDTHDDLHYRLLRGVDSETELRSALADVTRPHPGISPYIFTYAAQRPVFDMLAVDTFGQPRAWAQTPQTVIDCQVIQLCEGQPIQVVFDARRAAIPADVESAVFDLFTESIDDVIAGRCVESQLPHASQAWRSQINATPAAGSPAMLFSGFRQRVKQQPQAIALISSPAPHELAPERVDPLAGRLPEEQRWSYIELDQLALRLAARLVEHTAVGDIVGIRLPKGPAQIVAVLASLYAGCAYLPVGLDMPADRLATIRQRSGMRYLLTAADFDLLEQQTPLSSLRLPERAAEAVAYVIFTSGSTGEPKGVAVCHRAANNTIVDVNTRHDVTQRDVLLAVSSLDFDLSVYDIFGPLSGGGCIVTINENERRDAFRWAELVKSHRVTLWNSVPALAEMLAIAEDHLPSIRTYFCSGDWVAPSLFARLSQLSPQTILVAMGGSTEAAIWSNEYVIRRPDDLRAHWPSVPYGLPLSGQQYRVVREVDAGHFVDCPDGVTGELWIGGEGVAQGYLGDPQRTAERFVYSPGAADANPTRWYRTGDLGYWREELLFFVGRLDTQVKIQGYRVDCGEVEQTLKALPGIDNALVVPIRQRRALGALLVCDGADLDLEQLRQRLSCHLPLYMIPARFLIREQLLLNQNGKLDRQWASRELEDEQPVGQIDVPSAQSAMLVMCRQIWCQVLKLEAVNASDNFFALGGDSLAATRVCALLMAQGVQVAIGDLFAANTLEAFAQRCQPCAMQTSAVALAPEDHQRQPFPLTSLQRAYALGADGIPGVSRCDTVFSVIIRSSADHPVEHWQRALDELIQETTALRLVRTEADQQVASAQPVPVLMLSERHKLADFLAEASLDARQQPPLMLVTVAGQPTRIGLMCNYLALDALSLIRITLALVERVTIGRLGYQLESHITPFVHYVRQQERLEGVLPTWRSDDWLPPQLPSATVTSAICHIKSLTYRFDSRSRRQLEERAQRERVTLSALILKAYAEALIALCDRPQVVVVVPVCWRPPGSPQALGQFTQLRLCRYTQHDTPADVARALADVVSGQTPDDRYIAARGRAVYPFVFTSTIGIPEAELLYRRETRIEWTHARTPGVIIDCQVLPDGDGLEVRWDYAADCLAHPQLMATHARFMAQLIPGVGATGAEIERSSLPALGALAAGLSGHQIAERAIAAALAVLGNVPDVLAPVVAAWQRQVAVEADIVRQWREVGQFLASCVDGGRPRNDLLRHPLLAPERLLLASLQQNRFFGDLVVELRADFSRLDRVQSRLRILILGAGSGAFGQVLAQVAADNGLPINIDEYEQNDVLNTLAQRSGLATGQVEPVPDVIIAPATLHRDDGLLARLAKIGAVQERKIPIRLHVLEVTESDAASLVAALLDPTLVDGGPSPLLTASAWGQRLERHGAVLEQVQRLAANLVWIKAELGGSYSASLPADPPASYAGRTEVAAQIAHCWETVLELKSPVSFSADFFALGGDSLRATQIVMALRQQGHLSIRLADVFNHPTFTDFVDWVLEQRVTASEQAVTLEEHTADYPLTALQKAYLAGRSPEQVLGGVASHCYFEFFVSQPEGIDVARWQQAVSQVVARHDALRSRVVWHDGVPFGQVSAQVNDLIEVTARVRAATEAETPDPTEDYPLRIRLSPDGKTIGIGMDNLMLDGISMFLVMRELGEIYQGKSVAPSHTMTYAQYRHRYSESPGSVAVKLMPPAPRLPYLTTLDAVSHIRFARSTYDIEADRWRTVCQLTAQMRITPVALLLAAYALEIAELTDESAFSLNVTTFERDLAIPGVTTMVGDFTRLGLVAFDAGQRVTDADRRRQRLQDQARVAHQGILQIHETPEQVSTLRVAREVVRQRGEPMAGLFPVVFTSGLGLEPGTTRSDDFGFGTMTYACSQTPQVTMDFQVHDDVRGLHITVDYIAALLPPEQIDSLTSGVARRLQELVEITVSSPEELTELSAHIARVWRQYLSVEDDQPLDNFFQSGGDSLQATSCIRALQAEIDPSISLRLLLRHPRLNDFCSQVAQLIAQAASQGIPPAGGVTDFDEGQL
ncbi:non-ribosomal peptide synthetase [Serratia fonticola]|uniref:non-ribosomal peptide synthetase n=1 Tax=Serratia fonticola TaxID=47917 RepID=UPI002DBBC7B4|nr:non-ribosomal peptide synthetase [Serratia fonticola]MEB7884718.1 amino acid adenylation domain-containing protein [Serratia fonticola]